MAELYVELNISEWNRAVDSVAKLNDGNTYRGIFRDTIPTMLEELRSYAEEITHVLTGWLASSHRWSYDSHRMKGKLYIDPNAVYLRGKTTVAWPKIYGPYEHERGGEHAFYARTVDEYGEYIMLDGMRAMVRGLPG